MTVHPALSLKNISKGFPGVQALENVGFELAKGEVRALLGENGAGKSTILRILSGLFRADSGEIEIAGKLVDIRNPKQAKQAGIALIHQELQQVPELDVAQNMFLGAPITKFGIFKNQKLMREKAKNILVKLDPSIDVRTKIKNLRVAQRQIVEIAKALLSEAKIIAMDEPTSSLTPIEFERLVEVIEQLKSQDVAIIYVSHKLDEVFRVASHATILRDGQKVSDVNLSSTTEEQVVSLMVGRALEIPTHLSHLQSEVTLKVEHLSCNKAVANVSFDLRRGEVLGVAGLVGSGRTELVRLITGVDKPTSGQILLNGKNISFADPRQAIAAGIALLPEDRKKEGIIPQRSIASNASLPSLSENTRLGIIKKTSVNFQVDQHATSVNLRPHQIGRAIKFFSGGNQQKAILSRWLMAGSDILVFDEPTRGIDVGAKAEIYRLIENLAKQGRSIIVVSSELPEIFRLCDNVIVMRSGEMVGKLARHELNEESVMGLAITGKAVA